MKIIISALLCAACLAACKKTPPPENIPQPKAAEEQAAEVSTAPAAEQNPLRAPGNYLKTTVGHVDEAKAARDLYEKTAKQQAASLDLNDTGGN